MPIATALISEEEWVTSRQLLGWESKNANLIKRFNIGVELLRHKYNGVLKYYKFVKNDKINSSSVLEYTESSPFARLFKVSPNGYFLYNYDNLNLWKNHYIDSNILDKYTNETNKYTQPKKEFTIQHDKFILFSFQANPSFLPHSFNVADIFNIIKWAKQTKQPIYFKLHPYTHKDSHILKIWHKLKDSGYIDSHIILVDQSYNVDHLIDNCTALWTFSSGTGFQALLKSKPVAIFHEYTDYAPLANYVTTPEQAFNVQVTPIEDTLRYLSWYYHKLTIDVTADNFIDRLDERFLQVFNKELPIDKIF